MDSETQWRRACRARGAQVGPACSFRHPTCTRNAGVGCASSSPAVLQTDYSFIHSFHKPTLKL